MPSLLEAFNKEACEQDDKPLHIPGMARVAKLLGEYGVQNAPERVREAYSSEGWDEDRSLSFSEFKKLGMELGIIWSNDPDGEGDDATESAVPIDASKGTFDLVALTELVGNRAAEQAFPLILPGELTSREAAQQAELLLRFVRESEMMRLQKYLDRAFETYQAQCPAGIGLTQVQSRTAFALDSYFAHIHEFICAEVLQSRTFRHRFEHDQFLPLLLPSKLKTNDEQEAGEDCLQSLAAAAAAQSPTFRTKEFCRTFDDALWYKFEAYENIVKFSTKTLEELFVTFLNNEYYSILKDVLATFNKPKSARIRPAYPVTTDNADAEEQQARLQLIEHLEAQDVNQVECIISEELESVKAKFTPEMRSGLPDDFDETYRQRRYYQVLANVIDERLVPPAVPSCEFVPKVDPQEGCSDAAEIERRRELIKTLPSSITSDVDTRVKQWWESDLEKQPAAIRSLLPNDPPQRFWIQQYYNAVAEVAATLPGQQPEQPSEHLADTVQVQADTAPWTLPAAQPGQVVQFEHGSAQSQSDNNNQQIFGLQSIMSGSAFFGRASPSKDDVVMEFVSSRTLLSGVEYPRRVRYEGILVYHDQQARDTTPRASSTSSSRKRSLGGAEEPNIACDLVLTDNSGPVLVTLWGNVATSFYSAIGSAVGPIVALDAMRVAPLPANSDWNGTSLTTIRVLHSTPPVGSRDGTTVTTAAKATSPYLGTEFDPPPEPPVCITQFVSVRNKLKSPFRISIRGVVTELSDMQFTQTESEKRTFILVDDAGMWIRCCAIGLQATSRALENSNEIIGYFGTGRKQVGSAPGSILFMRDSMIVQVKRRVMEPARRTEITIT